VTVGEALREAAAKLAGDAPRADAEILLAHVLGCSRASLLAQDTDVLSGAHDREYQALLERCRAGEPVAYLTGTKEFWSLPLTVTPDVLIPRPETELLVEWSLEVLSFRRKPESSVSVLDLGTGSGAIAFALAKERPDIRVIATDVSARALHVAHANADRLGIGSVEFSESDFFKALDSGLRRNDEEQRFQLIVSNPPYIAEGDPHLESLCFEPVTALTAGVDGLDAIRIIVREALAPLVPGGWLLLEHGATQGEAVRTLMREAGFADVETRRDLAGHERSTGGRRP
jgi:release factor glutamine methyltransferase